MSDELYGSINGVLSTYGVNPSVHLIDNITAYIEILLSWNKKISLTSVTDPSEILKFHFGESLFAAPTACIEDGRLADVGSGAGFPGVPLAMLLPDLHVLLIEPNMKKCVFLRELKRALNLVNIDIIRGRMQDLGAAEGHFDFVTSRAVGGIAELIDLSNPILREDGRIILWVGQDSIPSILGKEGWKWDAPTNIPGSEKRFILIGNRNYSS